MEIILLLTFIVLGIISVCLRNNLKDRALLQEVTNRNRGNQSERKLALKLLKSGKSRNAVFHDLYVPKRNGGYSQIDLVLATSVGIIVFEVKDYSGWIFGNAKHTQWTQVLAYGQTKYRFYNPIKQNQAHINTLKSYLKLPKKIPFLSVIVFFGDCELKEINYIPADTFITTSNRVLEVVHFIQNNYLEAQFSDKWRVVKLLNHAVNIGGDLNVQAKHKEQVKNYLGKHRIYD